MDLNADVRIPKRFRLLGQTIEVEFVSTLVHDREMLAYADYRRNRILLQADVEGTPILPSQLARNFLHECVHWVFHILGEEDLRDNERLVSLVAQAVQQMLTTAEWEDSC